MRKTIVGMALAGTLALAGATAAQDWPAGPVTMVVPFAAGGTTDVLGRLMAQRLGEILGQPVVVENVGGAGGMTGTLRVARAQPDGSQFLFSGLGPLVLNPALHKKPAYNAAADFAPVTLLAEVPLVLIARRDLPVNNLQEFIAYAKANETRMNFASAGSGSAIHMGCVLLNLAIGANIAHVPYRGSGPAMKDLIAGQTDFFCEALPTALPQIRSNTVKAIAILARNRVAALPDLPTAQEKGLVDFAVYTWFALFLPRATPATIVRRLQEATVEAAKTPSIRQRLDELGVVLTAPERMTPERLDEFVRGEIVKWGAAIKAAGMAAD